ncbi:MAG: hypothetical protein HZA77_01895 [Candidatus Schekmanbacteria bacterium]|nr:hypothetical protein [Candidatus Schekmanbacteria bacterium]
MKKLLSMFAAVFFTLTTLALFQFSERNAFASGQSIFNSKCSSCHSASQFKGISKSKFLRKAKKMSAAKKLTSKQLTSIWKYVK